jgi:hypothetical protein
MRTAKFASRPSRQAGQTLALVAICLVVLVAMAAMAIDLTTLYVARGETQRAADAAALAGAEALVNSGVTTAPTTANLRTQAQNLANGVVAGLLLQNTVGGATPTLVGGAPSIVYPANQADNPTVTVTLQRANVPTFFARIWGRTLSTVTATATAEAYNSSNPGGAGNNSMPPVAPKCVKPWLVPNFDPGHAYAPFVNADGTLANPGVWNGGGGGVIGEQITLANIWANCGGPLCGLASLPAILSAPTFVGYLPAEITSASGSCPSCSVGLPSQMSESVACCDTANVYTCGGGGPNVLIDLLHQRVVSTLEGAACLLTGGVGGGSGTVGNDTLNTGNFQSSGGADPMQITSGTPPHSGQHVTTSNQIVTLPIIDTTLLNVLLGQVKVIGFMQAFVQQTHNDGDLVITVLNISGCGSNVNTGSTAVAGGGVTPVPVRLIHN